MKTYKNLHGNSGVRYYDIGNDYIAVKFKGSSQIYRYSYQTAGKKNVEHAKLLAVKGEGLNTFISQHMHDDFE